MAGFFHFSLGILLLLLMKTIPAKAFLYPTKPIANTTYIAGQPALVTWTEDGTMPLLANVGRARIDLYAANNTFLTTLAKDIDPLALSTTLFIPSSVPAHYYRFNLRFKVAYPVASPSVSSRPLPRPRLRAPSKIVFTADFSITPNPLSIQSVFPLQTTSRKATRTSHSTTSSSSESTLVHLDVMPTLMIPTPASRLAPSSTAGTGGKRKSEAVGKSVKGRGVMQGAEVMGMGIVVKRLMDGWNSGEMAFRLGFIVWPALIGLSMAV